MLGNGKNGFSPAHRVSLEWILYDERLPNRQPGIVWQVIVCGQQGEGDAPGLGDGKQGVAGLNNVNFHDATLDRRDVLAAGIAHSPAEAYQIPAVVLVDDGELCAVVGPGDDGGAGVWLAADVEIASGGGVHDAGPLGTGQQEGDAEKLGERLYDVLGDGVQIAGDPGCVLGVVVVAQF
ncbi:hypothetical protein SDC9_164314 [bioreactor metagenome]|uniref:Uncharacterized protein n=1 Tax=bioreactor metagenome TaxID=1076179 RepID=A0A645FRA2_9ZZZZ